MKNEDFEQVLEDTSEGINIENAYFTQVLKDTKSALIAAVVCLNIAIESSNKCTKMMKDKSEIGLLYKLLTSEDLKLLDNIDDLREDLIKKMEEFKKI